MEQPDDCPQKGHCVEGDRWQCQSVANWLDEAGNAPWGPDDEPAMMRYLASASAEELEWLTETAYNNLDSGWWEGYRSPHGGWIDGAPWDEHEARWRTVAQDFMARCDDGQQCLTEGMIRYAFADLCYELAWYRQWCPLT